MSIECEKFISWDYNFMKNKEEQPHWSKHSIITDSSDMLLECMKCKEKDKCTHKEAVLQYLEQNLDISI
jgi:elongation factor P--beta-lysine ligase